MTILAMSGFESGGTTGSEQAYDGFVNDVVDLSSYFSFNTGPTGGSLSVTISYYTVPS